MGIKLLFSSLAFILFSSFSPKSHPAPATACEQICGKWRSSEEKLVVQVYMEGDKFKAEIVWFDPGEGKPIETYTDLHNPDISQRNRKILGINVLRDLSYQPESNSWEDGKIYDCSSGKEWSASAFIDKTGVLKVKGYWHFKFIGRTLTFKRL